MTALVPVSEIERMALAVAKSGLFGVKTADQAMALMLIAQAEGLHPAIAARDYHVINGRPTLKADAMLARFQAAGGSVRWGEYTDKRVVGTFTHPQGGSVEIEWTYAMAERAGLTKNPTWKSYPRQMLRARCISEGIRTVFPGVVVGTYTPEEVEDMAPPQATQPAAPRDMGPVVEVADFAQVMRQIDAAQTVEELNALRPAIRTLDPDVRAEITDAAKQRAQQIRDNATVEASDDPI
jgi:hypothetical protein